MTEHVEDIDRGWKKIKRDMAALALKELAVDVGIVGKEAEEEHEGPGGERVTNVLVGSVHEFGAPGKGWGGADIHERSFIRATVDEKHGDIDRLFKRVARGAMGGRVEVKKGLGLVGEKVVTWIKARIRAGIPPPLSDVTVAIRKKQFGKSSTKPLIATGQLMGSITHVVRGAGEGDK